MTLSKTRSPDEQLQSEYTELQDRFKQLQAVANKTHEFDLQRISQLEQKLSTAGDANDVTVEGAQQSTTQSHGLLVKQSTVSG